MSAKRSLQSRAGKRSVSVVRVASAQLQCEYGAPELWIGRSARVRCRHQLLKRGLTVAERQVQLDAFAAVQGQRVGGCLGASFHAGIAGPCVARQR
jgi:hypothetical protein